MGIEIDLHRRQWEAEQSSSHPTTNATGLVMVFSGAGKGKSTAAQGLAWRSLYRKKRVGVVQFMSGHEMSAASQTLGKHALCDFKIYGTGCSWKTETRLADTAEMTAAWGEARRMLDNPEFDLVVLDDINWVLKHHYLSLDNVLHALQKKRRALHVALTGRFAPWELIDFADLATDMRDLKAGAKDNNQPMLAGIHY